jgi:hypothetical protein
MTLTSVNQQHVDTESTVPIEMACMSSNAAASNPTVDVSHVEKLSFNLSSDPSSREFQTTLRWLIYKIVEANPHITYVRLKKILHGEYGIDKRLVDTAISSLTSPTLFDCLTKWKNPRMDNVGAEIGIHLSVKESPSAQFQEWKLQILLEFPELQQLRAPVVPRNKQNTNRKDR